MNETTANTIFTIGHSNLDLEKFIQHLQKHRIQAAADVRSTPFSRRLPHFNKPELARALERANIAYYPAGDVLGGRPPSDRLYDPQGVADYPAMAQEPRFINALNVLQRTSATKRVVLICTEQDPINCHRTLLVANALSAKGSLIQHILKDATLEDHSRTADRILALNQKDALQHPPERRTREAFLAQSKRVAHRRKP